MCPSVGPDSFDAQRDHDAALADLRSFGLSYPGAHTKSPWPGHADLAVNDKTFVYLSLPGEPFAISCKLPLTRGAALRLPFTRPTAYGLGNAIASPNPIEFCRAPGAERAGVSIADTSLSV